MSARWSLASTSAGLSASCAYVGACIYDFVISGRGDPYLIVRDIHFGYYHRVALAAWIGGIGGIVVFAYAHSETRTKQTERVLLRAALPIVCMLTVLTFVFP